MFCRRNVRSRVQAKYVQQPATKLALLMSCRVSNAVMMYLMSADAPAGLSKLIRSFVIFPFHCGERCTGIIVK